MSNEATSKELANDRTDMADERTDWAEDRTIMANERAFSGWMRTGLAAVGIGLGFNALFGKLEPIWIPKAIATLFMVIRIFETSRWANVISERISGRSGMVYECY